MATQQPEEDKDKAAADKAAAKAAKKADIENIKPKKEWEGATGIMHSPHLDRKVNVEAAIANPKLYLKKYARKYVKQDGKGSYPLLDVFDLSQEQIQALAAL
jgi:hypothetical protein